jgi:hypothetical protein
MREYNGQPQTFNGERGKTKVKGVTIGEIADCIIQGFLAASGDARLQHRVVELDKSMLGSEYANNGMWVQEDVYKIDFDNIDPIAVVQNAVCHIEGIMGIYPNVPNLLEEHNDEN